ncbi:MAG: hypothetical protein ACO3DS_06545 [Phycisphaerales bacterium]
MQSRSRDVAKFLAGIAFSESVGHLWLGIWGQDMLPWSFGSFTFTSTMNAVAMVAWPAVLVALVWFAWFREPAPRDR